MNYEDFVLRNEGYIDKETQAKIRSSRVLIAGCGIGSQAAEVLARIGFEDFILVDGDDVSVSNLNRQFFFYEQVGQNKVDALYTNLKMVNPNLRAKMYRENLSSLNVRKIVSEADIVLDTIDFLDLQAIVCLHDEALIQRKVVFSSFSVGFGAAIIYLPFQERKYSWIRDIFRLPKSGDLKGVSYVKSFMELFTRLGPSLDPAVVHVMKKVFQSMADGAACPAPQVAPGAVAVGSLCATAIVQFLQGDFMTSAPAMIVNNLSREIKTSGVPLGDSFAELSSS